MRVIEPQKRKKTTSKRLPMTNVISVMLVSSLLAGWWFLLRSPDTVTTSTTQNNASQETIPIETAPKETAKNFSGDEYQLLFDNALLKNQRKIDVPPVITGNDIADARIYQRAKERGYELRTQAYAGLVNVNGIVMQQDVRNDWLALQEAARLAGLQLSVTSAYRSIQEQTTVFLDVLREQGVSDADLVNGLASEGLEATLTFAAPPGYSKHHSGYAMDFFCSGFAFREFASSTCHEWITAENYAKAREFGFIPSYPSDANFQGPSPEAWEYVWVGRELLQN